MPTPEPDASYLANLADGRQVQIDSIGPSDRADLLAGFESLSPRTRYLRFLTSMPQLHDFILDGLLNTDPPNHVAFGARLIDPATGARTPQIVGVARYFRSAESPHIAEPAIAVADELHGLGLGKRLLRKLSATARANGVTHFRANVLDENRQIKTLLQAADAEIVEQDGTVLTYDVDIRRTANPSRGVLARLLGAMLHSDATEVR